MRDEIVSGIDELGVLLAGHDRNAYWYGSQLSIEVARSLAPQNSATSLQVCAAVLAGFVWVLQHPDQGVTEAEEIDHQWMLRMMKPYLSPVRGYYTDGHHWWTGNGYFQTHLILVIRGCSETFALRSRRKATSCY